MKIIYDPKAAQRPFADVSSRPRNSSGDYWGAFSIESFCNVGGLSYTHEDAQGWLKYLEQFQPPNFWYKDGNVKPWAYYEDYDNWQDTYGMDAVMAVYHSGHGGMDSNGVFQVPLGADWGNLGCWVFSDKMRLGNEQANYIFWSTCLSLRVLDGHNPIRTWQGANLGFRMLFGFETVSWDNPNYGKFFWEEWNKNKSLSTAWMDASWRIAHDQSPSVVACGANQADATNRLNNERFMVWDHVQRNWWQWKWYSAARSAMAQREVHRAVPKELLIAELAPPQIDEQRVSTAIEQFGIDTRLPEEVKTTQEGSFSVENGESHIVFSKDGSYDVQLRHRNSSNTQRLQTRQATAIAREAIQSYGLSDTGDLVFDRIRLTAEGGGTTEGSGQLEGPYTTETTVQFRQVINGLPVITPGAGVVRIGVDNDGAVTSVHRSTRQIDRLVDRPRNTTAMPDGNNHNGDNHPNPIRSQAANGSHGSNGSLGKPRTTDPDGYEQMLGEEWAKRMASWAMRGRMPMEYATVPGSTEVGYDIRGNEAVVVARRAIEVDFGSGLRKRYWVTTPIYE